MQPLMIRPISRRPCNPLDGKRECVSLDFVHPRASWFDETRGGFSFLGNWSNGGNAAPILLLDFPELPCLSIRISRSVWPLCRCNRSSATPHWNCFGLYHFCLDLSSFRRFSCSLRRTGGFRTKSYHAPTWSWRASSSWWAAWCGGTAPSRCTTIATLWANAIASDPETIRYSGNDLSDGQLQQLRKTTKLKRLEITYVFSVENNCSTWLGSINCRACRSKATPASTTPTYDILRLDPTSRTEFVFLFERQRAGAQLPQTPHPASQVQPSRNRSDRSCDSAPRSIDQLAQVGTREHNYGRGPKTPSATQRSCKLEP